MERLPKFVLAATTVLSMVLAVIVGRQAKQIDRLERDAHPERYAKAMAKSEVSNAALPEIPAAKSVLMKTDRQEEELVGETRLKIQTGAWNKGLSRDEESECGDRLRAMGVGKLHNFGAAYGSDGNILIRGTVPVVELNRVAYEFRPTPDRKGVWNVYRVQWTPDGGAIAAVSQLSSAAPSGVGR